MSRSVVLTGILLYVQTALAIPVATDFRASLLPMTCAELLPDTTPYLQFFEAVGRGHVRTDRRIAKRVYKILTLRDKMLDIVEKGKGENPIEQLIRKTLCFYRQQSEPLKAVPFDDPKFLSYFKTALPELETKIGDAIFEWEVERQQKKAYERSALMKQKQVDAVLREADVEADQMFEKLSRRAKQKVMTP